ncbi:MAG TPA: NTP transferase domain-containing protein [Acidimicrobiales bacterium]|nr:NTP transferase domain-containing protein [Acidimicrobiales bacterium]
MNVAGLLLTGGPSQRMGTDKAALVVDGVPLAERAASALRAVVSPVLEVGPGWSSLPAVTEAEPGGGPLGALAAGAAALSERGHTGGAVVLATDLPFVSARLVAVLASHPSDATVVPVVAGRRQPLAARYSPGALSAAPVLFAAGRRSLAALLDEVDAVELAEDGLAGLVDLRELEDVDTPEDLARLGLGGREGHTGQTGRLVL